MPLFFPGLRELRAPLVAGFLWLTAFWLWIDLPTRAEVARSGGARQSLMELGDAVGRPGLLAVAALAAYLIGSLSEEARHWSRRWRVRPGRLRFWLEHRRVTRRGWLGAAAPMSDRGQTSVHRYLDQALREVGIEARKKGYDDVRVALGLNPDDVPSDEVIHLADWQSLTPDVALELYQELGLVRTRLISQHADIAAEYDRLQAESNLRYAFALPATVLFVTLAAQDSALWLLGLIGAVLIAWQGRERAREAGDVIADALLAGSITAPAVDRLHARLESAPDGRARDREPGR